MWGWSWAQTITLPNLLVCGSCWPRVRAMLRRSRMTSETLFSTGVESYTAGDLEVDLSSHTARLGAATLNLKPREFDLLALLVSNKGRAITRDQILERLWGYDYIGDTRTVDVHVRWLREKIEAEPGSPKRISHYQGCRVQV